MIFDAAWALLCCIACASTFKQKFSSLLTSQVGVGQRWDVHAMNGKGRIA